ncbi:Hypothetical protein NocV09_05800130 [Nannochloropsis oceanica]
MSNPRQYQSDPVGQNSYGVISRGLTFQYGFLGSLFCFVALQVHNCAKNEQKLDVVSFERHGGTLGNVHHDA